MSSSTSSMALADPPDLSRLALRDGAPIGETLLQRLARANGGRAKDCTKHEYPVGDMGDNCAKDGYLMVKEAIAYPPNPGVAAAANALGRDYLLTDAFGKPCKVRALRRDLNLRRRKQIFEEQHEQYLNNEQNFKRRCAQFFNRTKDAAGKDIVETFGLEYEKNIANIARYTDFYYIDHDAPLRLPDEEERAYLDAVKASQAADNPKSRSLLHMATDRGFIFLSVMDTLERKLELDMPHQGVYAEPYVYVLIVCAAGYLGYGSVLLDLGEQLAAQVGVRRMALAALPNACGAYYARGYRFAPWSGDIYEVSEAYFGVDDKGKCILLWDKDVRSEQRGAPSARKCEEREAREAREAREEPEGAAPRMRTRSQSGKRARGISSAGTADVQTARLPEWLLSTA